MSQAPEQELHGRKAKTSSAGIFGTFSAVTGGRNPTTRSADNMLPSRRRSINVASVIRDSTRQEQHVPHKPEVRPQDIGQLQIIRPQGPSELKDYIDELHPNNAMESRLEAAKKIMPILAEYTIGNVMQVWSAARDLIDQDDKAAVTVGYELLLSCAKDQTVSSTMEKRLLFDSLVEEASLDHIAIRLNILDQLTDHARHMDGLEAHVVTFLSRLLKQCYEAAAQSRQMCNKTKPPNTIEELDLSRVFQYAMDLIKYNSKVLRDIQIEIVLTQLSWICRRTTTESDIAYAIRVFETILTYSYIPHFALRSFVEVMCEIYCGVKKLRSQCWSALRNLLCSHLGPEAVQNILDILHENPQQESRNINTVRGAVLALHEILMPINKDEIPQPGITDSMSALRAAIIFNSAKLECDILHLLTHLLSLDDTQRALLGGSEWNDFTTIIAACAQREANAPERNSPTPHFINDTDLNAQLTHELGGIGEVLLSAVTELDHEHQMSLMHFLADFAVLFDDNTARGIVEFFHTEHMLLSSDEDWLENSRQLLNGIMKHLRRSRDVRIMCLLTVTDAYRTFGASQFSERNRLMVTLMDSVQSEEDVVVLETLTKYVEHVAVWTTDTEIFATIIGSLEAALYHNHDVQGTGTSHATDPPLHLWSETATTRDQYCTSLAKSLVKIFLQCINLAAWKALKLYNTLLGLAESKTVNISARVTCLKLLVRLRSDVNGAIFVTSLTESEHLASLIGRTGSGSPSERAVPDTVGERSSRPEEQSSRRKAPVSASSSHSAKPGSSRSRRGTEYRSIVRRVPPMWMYPGPSGLPVQPPSSSSAVLFAHTDPSSATGDDSSNTALKTTINIQDWLDVVILILRGHDFEWEIYIYIVVHLTTPLRNHSLFANCEGQIRTMRTLLCAQLASSSFPEPPAYTNQKKADVSICLHHILTVLISYRHCFTKSEEDEIARTFLLGLGSRDGTSESCIHALSICCHELPSSVSKSMESILQRMAQSITQSATAVHILEFLAGLARLPELFKNFREEEFRLVFGICIRYLQYAREPRSKGSAGLSDGPSPRGGNHDLETDLRHSLLAEELPQYVYALTYHVMTFWFMSLKLQDRPHQMALITKSLVHKDSNGLDVMEEQAQVLVDMMHRVAFSDRDDTIPTLPFSKPIDGSIERRSWLVGLSILTIETAGRTGKTQITRRRPTSTKYSILTPTFQEPPRHQVAINRGLVAESYYTESYVGVLPDDIFQEYYAPQHLSSAVNFAEQPIPLPGDEATIRALGVFDRIPAIDGHKIGVVYVGEDQTTEAAILPNVMGSDDYTTFLHRLGSLTRLKGATLNTQGLDREFDSDGEFTICWRDRTSELVFHVATMMPTNMAHDPGCVNKKRHIGNDFVNIIFNNSGRPFAFETIPSQFNYVNIVITPEARASFVTTRLRAQAAKVSTQVSSEDPAVQAIDPTEQLFYNVAVLSKPGLPRISPAYNVQTVSGASLPAFVRLLALNASVFCGVWEACERQSATGNNGDGGGGAAEYPSSWRSRLREIVKLRERHGGAMAAQAVRASAGSGSSAAIAAAAAAQHGRSPLPPLNTSGAGQSVISPPASAHVAEAMPATGGVGANGGVGSGGREGSVFRRGSVFGSLEPGTAG